MDYQHYFFMKFYDSDLIYLSLGIFFSSSEVFTLSYALNGSTLNTFFELNDICTLFAMALGDT